MTGEVTDEEKMRRLPWSFGFNATSSAFGVLTYFGPVFVLFLSELGLGKTSIGLLLSMLPFTGLLALVLASTVARAGVKRVFITFYSARKAVTALLLLTPWVLARFGPDRAFLLVAGVVLAFALCRAIAETAIYPWWQEVVPNGYRGRYNGINHILGLVASAIALAVASLVVETIPGLERFLLLIGVGVAFGAVSAACVTQVPGGAPRADPGRRHFRSIRQALRDLNLLRYLVGMGFVYVILHTVLMSFVPLFMKEQVGLGEGQILLLQVGSYVAGLLSSYIWGWAADHLGSKPVALTALYMMILPPVIWLLIPRNSGLSFVIALAAAALAGMAAAGWLVGDQRLLYVNVVPVAKRTEYMAVFYAWMGLVGGFGPLVAGAALDFFQGIGGSILTLTIDPYTPLFLTSIGFLSAGAVILSRLKTGEEIGVRTLVSALLGSLLRGNPFKRLRP
jgi:MFS-type transporter involved in bile tolerance (Atg22 family)